MRRALALGVAVALLAASPAAAHQGNPNFRSVVDAVTPAVKGLTLRGITAVILGALGLIAGLAAFAARRSGASPVKRRALADDGHPESGS